MVRASRLVVALIAIAGCDGVLGLPSAQLADARGDALPPGPKGLLANAAFVTSTTHVPTTFGSDLSGADRICAQRAAAAGLDKLGDGSTATYVAYLATNGSTADGRLMNARGWVRPDGKPVADRVSDLTGGKLFYPLRVDENGLDLSPSDLATTGSQLHCNDYTDSAGQIELGSPFRTLGWFDDGGASPCTQPVHIYCFGVSLVQPVVVMPPAGRRAFLTAQPFTVAGGIGAADTQCMTEATGAGLTGTFLALLPTSTATAMSRFALTGDNWLRLDGVAIAETTFKFAAVDWLTSLSVTSLMQYEAVEVTTGGTLGAPVPMANTCNDWMASTNTNTTMALSDASDGAGVAWLGTDCSPRRIYCVEP